MTKKDYELIASNINKQYKLRCCGMDGERITSRDDLNKVYIALDALAYHLANEFEQDNPRFNREMFLTACGFSDD